MARDFTTFAEMLDMASHGPDVWVGKNGNYPWFRVYGGQVAAQALWAAAQTVDPGYLPHSLHAYFIRGGEPGEPIRFEVDRIRDGRSFVTRRVVARQSSGAILNMSASFQAEEEAPDVTAMAFPADVIEPEQLSSDDWGVLLERRSVPRDENRARTWLRVVGPLGDDPLVHLIAHTYASDDMPTEAVELQHPLGRPDHMEPDFEWPYMGATLDHAIWFHRPAPADDWVLHDCRSSGVARARGVAFGELFTRDGLHIASVAQEVLLRELRGAPPPAATAG